MKAVLVLDMPDGVSLDEWYAVTVVVDRLIATEEELKQGIPYDESKVFKFVPLRPLPKKKDVPPNYGMMVGDPRGEGWNECLKEILGKECD